MPKPTVSGLRALAASRGFKIKRGLTGARRQLVDLVIGHKIRNGRWPSFSVKEAHRYMRDAEPAETRWVKDN